MKTILTVLLILALIGTSNAAPYLVCDNATGVDYYVIEGLPAPLNGDNITALKTGPLGFKFDIAQVPVGGPYSVRAKACDMWGCSDFSPFFVFSRPAKRIPPVGTRLSK